jgi:hypothetical protein
MIKTYISKAKKSDENDVLVILKVVVLFGVQHFQ